MLRRDAADMQNAMDRLLLWVVTTVWRDGGQRGARINAWQAMVADTRRARERADMQLGDESPTPAPVVALR
jgi:hypothetical protein